ncbi:hypothetical protein B0H19DRAFT_1074200 [Mycena capillaripes]|nr:hypothetical protein B0H19DRAFT_1074200 [Mycena capillaripes]
MQSQLSTAIDAQRKSEEDVLNLEIQYAKLDKESQKVAEESDSKMQVIHLDRVVCLYKDQSRIRLDNNLRVTSAVLADQRVLVSILKQEIDDQAKKLEDKDTLVSELESQLQDAFKITESYESQLQDKQKRITTAQKEIVAWNFLKFAHFLQELEKANANVVNLEIALNQEKDKSKTSQQKLQKLLDASSDVQTVISKLQAENFKLRAEVAGAQQSDTNIILAILCMATTTIGRLRNHLISVKTGEEETYRQFQNQIATCNELREREEANVIALQLSLTQEKENGRACQQNLEKTLGDLRLKMTADSKAVAEELTKSRKAHQEAQNAADKNLQAMNQKDDEICGLKQKLTDHKNLSLADQTTILELRTENSKLQAQVIIGQQHSKIAQNVILVLCMERVLSSHSNTGAASKETQRQLLIQISTLKNVQVDILKETDNIPHLIVTVCTSSRISGLQKRLKSAHTHIDWLDRRAQMLQVDYDDIQRLSENVQKTVSSQQTTINELREENLSLLGQHLELQTSRGKLEQQISSQRTIILEVQAQNSVLSGLNVELEAQYHLELALQQSEVPQNVILVLCGFCATISRLQLRLNHVHRYISSQEKEHKNLQLTHRALKSAVVEIQGQSADTIEEMKRHIETLKCEQHLLWGETENIPQFVIVIGTLISHISHLRGRLSGVHEHITWVLEETVGNHQDQLEKLESHIQELKSQNDTLQTQIYQLRDRYTKINEALKRSKIENSQNQVREALANVQNEAEDYRTRAQSRITLLQQELNNLQIIAEERDKNDLTVLSAVHALGMREARGQRERRQ